MASRKEYRARKNRESLGKRLGARGRRIKSRDGHRCVYCHADEIAEAVAGRSLHLDHVDAKHAGGKDSSTNLVTACHGCNSSKHDMTLEQWSRWAAEHKDLHFSPKSIRALAAKELPELADRETRQGQHEDYEHHRAMAREHEKSARATSDETEKNAHEVAALVHNVAARAAKDGRLSEDHRRAAKAATATAKGEADRSAAARKAWATRRAS